MSSGPSGDKLIRVDMTSQSAEVVEFPDGWRLLGGRALSAQDPAGGVRSHLRSARARKRSGDGARRALRDRSAYLGPHLHRRQEPAHRRHQGGQCRRSAGAASDEARLQGHRRHRCRPGSRAAIRPRDQRRRDPGGSRRRVQGDVELRALRGAPRQVPEDRVLHLLRARRRARTPGCIRGLHRPGQPLPRPPRGARRSRRRDGEEGAQVRDGRSRSRPAAPARRSRRLRSALQELHQELPGRSPDVQEGHRRRGPRGERTAHLPVQEPHQRTVPRRRDTRWRPHQRELREARGQDAQLHDRLHREVQQHRPRRPGQVQDVGPRVRDPHAARLELRHRELGGRRRPRSPV